MRDVPNSAGIVLGLLIVVLMMALVVFAVVGMACVVIHV